MPKLRLAFKITIQISTLNYSGGNKSTERIKPVGVIQFPQATCSINDIIDYGRDKFCRNLWRSNALIISVAGIAVIVVLSFAGIYLIKDIFRERNVVNKVLSTLHRSCTIRRQFRFRTTAR